MTSEIQDLERRIQRVASVLIVLSIAAIAAADRLLARHASLGFLYLVPLSACSSTTCRPRRTSR